MKYVLSKEQIYEICEEYHTILTEIVRAFNELWVGGTDKETAFRIYRETKEKLKYFDVSLKTKIFKAHPDNVKVEKYIPVIRLKTEVLTCKED